MGDEVTEVFSTELQRVNLSKTSWAERTMIWRGRSLVYAEKQRQVGEELRKPTFAESVLAATVARWMGIHGCEQSRRNRSPRQALSRPL